MSSATVDTNVLASGFVGQAETSAPAAILDAWRARRFTMALSEHILDELAATFEAPYFTQRLTRVQAAANLALLRGRAQIVSLTNDIVGVATHPEDDLVLATAVSAGVDVLVTGDTKLQRLGTVQGVMILSPRQFLDALTDSEASESADKKKD